jgi:glycosyltransferase involved in cell wall biosynthesis
MPATEVSVSVVVCAYTDRRAAQLLDAIASLRRQTSAPHEVIVVIDHNPRLEDWLRRCATDVLVMANAEQPGLAGARITGLAAATGQIVAFLDDDAVAEPVWLEQLAAHYRDEGTVAVGGAVVPVWEDGDPAWMPPEFHWVVGCTYRGMPVRATSVRNLIGCNMSFRREVATRAGGFHSGLGRVGTRPLGCEETELSKAEVARQVGRERGLANERAHALRTLPAGVWGELRAACASRHTAPLGRAVAIVVGLGVTTAGYVRGRATA